MVKKVKVTEKNIKRISSSIEKELKKALSIFHGTDGKGVGYETKRVIRDRFAVIYITSTSNQKSYITSYAMSYVGDVCKNSRWKDSMWHGIEVMKYNDKGLNKEIYIPCISVSIEIEKEDEQQG